MYMGIRRIVQPDIMKKSEKAKGKAAVAARTKSYRTYGIILVIAIILVAAAGYYVFANHTLAKTGDTVAKTGDNVSVYYTGKLENGTVFDSNINTTPLEFTLGSGKMISGFDEAVTGMAVGEEKTVTLPVDKAYGPYYPDRIVQVNRTGNVSVTNPVVGQHLVFTDPSTGANYRVKIINVTPSTMTVDANYDLAGQNLTFTIKLATINNA
jgi:peptidylprolyl isomerase